jgi:plasmid maintenance system antidote protein VapI
MDLMDQHGVIMDIEMLRSRLHEIIMRNPKSYSKLAPEMGINRATLSSFLDGRKKTHPRLVHTIADYIGKEEGKNNKLIGEE